MTEFVTILFEFEFKVLILLAQSFEHSFRSILIRRIYIYAHVWTADPCDKPPTVFLRLLYLIVFILSTQKTTDVLYGDLLGWALR